MVCILIFHHVFKFSYGDSNETNNQQYSLTKGIPSFPLMLYTNFTWRKYSIPYWIDKTMIATPWTPRIRHQWSKSTMVKSLKSWQADITVQNIPTQKMTTLHVSALLVIFFLTWFYSIQYIWRVKILIYTFIHWANISISPMYKGILCVWCVSTDNWKMK